MAERRRSERATALVLVPAMMLVLLCLAAIAIDMSLLHAMHRDAHRVASAAAEDAAGMLDERELHTSGRLVVDRVRAERVARARVGAADLAATLREVRVSTGVTTVEVTLALDAPHVVLPSLPGTSDFTRLVVSARGRLHR